MQTVEQYVYDCLCINLQLYIYVSMHIANVFAKMHVKPGPHMHGFHKNWLKKTVLSGIQTPLEESLVGGCLGYYTPQV